MLKQLEIISDSQNQKLTKIRDYFKELKSTCIAYSGGVDSALVATIAFEQLGGKALAITGVSPALAESLLKEARIQAQWIGIKHIEIETSELRDEIYSKNSKERCYACKRELHKHTSYLSDKLKYKNVVDGVNFDDLSDYRPGIRASKEAGVISPLAIFKFTKKDIREISRSFGLPWWDKPAQPCLSSRFPYGYEITHHRLRIVDEAESYIRNLGFSNVRVRSQGTSARIEIPQVEIKKFITEYNRKEIIDFFLSLGFKAISLDLEGLISGKLNR